MSVARGEDMNAANTPGAWEALSDGDLAGSLLEALWGSPVPIAIFDSQLRVARVNPAMAQLNGVSASAHVGRRLSEALPLLEGQKLLSGAAVGELGESYRFLRRLENRLQERNDEQTHELPHDDTGRARLALSMGASDWPTLESEIARHRDRVSRTPRRDRRERTITTELRSLVEHV